MKNDPWNNVAFIFLGILIASFGIYLLVNRIFIVGTFYHYQLTAEGGPYYVLAGIIILMIGIINLPPDSGLRKFFSRKNK